MRANLGCWLQCWFFGVSVYFYIYIWATPGFWCWYTDIHGFTYLVETISIWSCIWRLNKFSTQSTNNEGVFPDGSCQVLAINYWYIWGKYLKVHSNIVFLHEAATLYWWLSIVGIFAFYLTQNVQNRFLLRYQRYHSGRLLCGPFKSGFGRDCFRM